MRLVQRLMAMLAAALALVLASGCSTPASLLLLAAEQGVSTAKDPVCLTAGCAATAMLQHAYDKLTEGDPVPCRRLNSVARALTPRCGPFLPGSLRAPDVAAPGLPVCPLTLAARDPAFWPMLPELIALGADAAACTEPPIAALAAARPCPDFRAAPPAALDALRDLAETDARAVQHDVVRLLSCPSARAAGLDGVLERWLAAGRLTPSQVDFNLLGALHPAALATPLAQAIEAAGHRAAATLGHAPATQPAGFDLALRNADRRALDWWFARLPGLANRVPAARPGQLAWLPLARVVTPGYLADPAAQAGLVGYLLARGADPWQRLPHDARHSVVDLARQFQSDALAQLDTPLVYPAAPTQRAALAPALAGPAAEPIRP